MKKIYLKPMTEVHQLNIVTCQSIISQSDPANHGDANRRNVSVDDSPSDSKRSLWGN